MVLSRVLGILVAFVLMPFFAMAQEEDALHAAIRADIQRDPRSSEMSPTEIDTLIEALAARAEEQKTAQDYLDAQNSFEPMEAPVYEVAPEDGVNPLTIAIGALVIVVLGVMVLLVSHRRHSRTPFKEDIVT
jgi:hypothetical protein